MAAKAKYEKWIEPDGLLLLSAWARDGLTEEQIAANMGIARQTLYEWKKRFADIADAIKTTREIVDVTVENALYKKTQGYTVQLRKTVKLKFIEYGPDGKKKREWEELAEGVDEVHVPAETIAQLAWLNNRKPESWRRNAGKEKLDEKKFEHEKETDEKKLW